MTITSLGDNRNSPAPSPVEAVNAPSHWTKLYGEFVQQCCSPKETIHERITSPRLDVLLHAALGCTTESGEFADQIKKALVYGRDLDEVNVKEELGDMLWYIQLGCNILECTVLDLISMNMRKLAARYPGKFTKEAELLRNLDEERRILETNNKGA